MIKLSQQNSFVHVFCMFDKNNDQGKMENNKIHVPRSRDW